MRESLLSAYKGLKLKGNDKSYLYCDGFIKCL